MTELRGPNCPECNVIPGYHKESCSQRLSVAQRTTSSTSEVGDAIRQLWQENPHLDQLRMEGLALQVDDLWRRAQEHRYCEKVTTKRNPDRDPLDSDFGPNDHPELQIHVSQEGLMTAANVLGQIIPNLFDEANVEIAGRVVAAALTTPPTVTEHTVEVMVRALLMTYPDHRWDGIKLRQMVEGLLLSLGVEVKS